MAIKPNYRKGIIIVHGKSEYLLAEHIKSNLHLPIEIYDRKTSIQIDSLMDVLENNIFRSKTTLTKNYCIEEENKELKNFFIMPIMDLDDTTEEKIEKYKSGEMFANHPLSKYIIPIWNNKNLEQVLFELNLIDKMPSDKEKVRVYKQLFPTNNGETDLEQVKKLLKIFESSNKTNMDIFIKKCLELVK